MEATPTLALGTVQWGTVYGIANRTGQATAADVARMVGMAMEAGLDTLDTARAYGEAEAVVGRVAPASSSWRVITKTDPMVCGPGASEADAAAATRASLQTSRTHLGRERLDGVLLHRPEHRRACRGAAWRILVEGRAAGEISAIGVSATTPSSALEALGDRDIDLMQVATSLLDRRLVARGFFDAARAHGVEVHIRSAFLQGVAFMASEDLPPSLAALGPSLARIDTWAGEHETTRAVAFLAYALSLPVSRVVIGCERPEQLEDNLSAMARARTLVAEVGALAAELPVLSDALLDPSQWSG